MIVSLSHARKVSRNLLQFPTVHGGWAAVQSLRLAQALVFRRTLCMDSRSCGSSMKDASQSMCTAHRSHVSHCFRFLDSIGAVSLSCFLVSNARPRPDQSPNSDMTRGILTEQTWQMCPSTGVNACARPYDQVVSGAVHTVPASYIAARCALRKLEKLQCLPWMWHGSKVLQPSVRVCGSRL